MLHSGELFRGTVGYLSLYIQYIEYICRVSCASGLALSYIGILYSTLGTLSPILLDGFNMGGWLTFRLSPPIYFIFRWLNDLNEHCRVGQRKNFKITLCVGDK